MKLILVGPTYPYRGGIAHYTTLFFRAIQAQGHEVNLYSFKRLYPMWLYPGRSDRDPSNLKVEADCEYVLNTLNPLTWWSTAQTIRVQQPDMLVLQWWVPFFAPIWSVLAWVARREGVKIIFICHNVLPHDQYFWDVWLTKRVLQFGDGFIVQSQSEKECLLSLLPGRRVEVVPHPINDIFADYVISSKVARQRLELPQNAQVLLFFGLVREYKGLQYLLNAMPSVISKFPAAHLLIAGEFWQNKQSYLDQIARLGIEKNVTVIGRYIPNEEVPMYFSAADVVVLPYTEVTQSAVVQLAFGLNRPVITTRVGGLLEVIIDGKTGLLVPPADSNALAEAINHFFSDGVGLLMRQNLIKYQKNSSWKYLVQAVEALNIS